MLFHFGILSCALVLNLLGVYLDSVFFARLDPLDFAQEGHRLEFAEPADTSSELTYKGVVFNEM